MRVYSRQIQNAASLIGQSGHERGDRFDPAAVEKVLSDDGEASASYCGTRSIPTNLGRYTIAYYAIDGREPVPSRTEDIVRHGAEVGILVGNNSLQLLEPVPEDPSRLVATGLIIDDMGPRV